MQPIYRDDWYVKSANSLWTSLVGISCKPLCGVPSPRVGHLLADNINGKRCLWTFSITGSTNVLNRAEEKEEYASFILPFIF